VRPSSGLLFIYLELGAIVGIYFKTARLPVLFLLYVAITAITRFLAVDLKDLPVAHLLAGTGSILVLTLAALVLHVAAAKFPVTHTRARPSHLDFDAAQR
jgi:protein PsiE